MNFMAMIKPNTVKTGNHIKAKINQVFVTASALFRSGVARE
jgi:hypothetical protein